MKLVETSLGIVDVHLMAVGEHLEGFCLTYLFVKSESNDHFTTIVA
jgi:hypothetical protein